MRTYEAMVATYAGYGYELIEVPRLPVLQRARFVIESAGIKNETERNSVIAYIEMLK